MILFMLIYILSVLFLIYLTKKTKSELVFFIGIIVLVLSSYIIPITITSTLSNEKINTYSKQITEIKVKQYDIKDKNSEEYKENEDKLTDLIIQYNDEVSKYNDILKKDKKKFVLFRWYFYEKELDLNDLEVTTEYVAPDFYKG